MTTPAAPTIRMADAHDAMRWLELMDGYTRFYEREPDAAVMAHTWARVLDAASPVHAFVSVTGDRVVAIGNYVLHENTSTLAPVCYLQDLFVDPASRGAGIGRRMLDWLVGRMQSERWPRLYWNTRDDNARARALYDTYTLESGFVRYVLDAAPG